MSETTNIQCGANIPMRDRRQWPALLLQSTSPAFRTTINGPDKASHVDFATTANYTNCIVSLRRVACR